MNGTNFFFFSEKRYFSTISQFWVFLLSKFLQGGSGYARKITFEQITLIRAGNPIYIHQHYTHAQQMVHITLHSYYIIRFQLNFLFTVSLTTML